MPGSGPLAAAIPGAVDAWLMLGRDHGTRPLREVLSYAIGYARRRPPVLPTAVATIARVEQLFREHWPTSAARWLPLPRPWQLVTNPEHAATLERLVAEGEAAGTGREAQYDGARRAWREGFVAEAIDAFSRLPFRDSSGADHAGVLTGADLAGWSASYERPVVQRFRDVEVAKTDLWGQGPVLLAGVGHAGRAPGRGIRPDDADGVHTVIEVLSSRWPTVRRGSATPLRSPLRSCSTRRTSRRVGRSWETRASARAAAGVARRSPALAARLLSRRAGLPSGVRAG